MNSKFIRHNDLKYKDSNELFQIIQRNSKIDYNLNSLNNLKKNIINYSILNNCLINQEALYEIKTNNKSVKPKQLNKYKKITEYRKPLEIYDLELKQKVQNNRSFSVNIRKKFTNIKYDMKNKFDYYSKKITSNESIFDLERLNNIYYNSVLIKREEKKEKENIYYKKNILKLPSLTKNTCNINKKTIKSNCIYCNIKGKCIENKKDKNLLLNT